jgi:integrase
VIPALGVRKLPELRRSEVQRFATSLLREGLDPSTIRNALMPLRAVYRQALALDDVALNPVDGVQLPAVRGTRDRIASPEEAERLLAAVPPGDRPLWTSAFYAGLRLAELQALRWKQVDLAAGVIRVEVAWDPREGPISPKSRAGRRAVPVPAVLRDVLAELRAARRGGAGLVFGRTADIPFAPTSIAKRANDAWAAQDPPLTQITLHECRHTYASLMIAAGVNAKALATFMGHANISTTFDRYGHLMGGSESEAAELLDDFLERASSRARKAAVSGGPE